MTPMCDTTTGLLVGFAVGSADCAGTVELEYFDFDGVSEGLTLPVGWKPCVQGVPGPDWSPAYELLVYAATVDIDFAASEFQELELTGGVVLTGSNYSAPREITVIVRGDSAVRSIGFPTGWVFTGTEPTTVGIGKTGVLKLISVGTAEADVIASWQVQA